jgi:HAD superfamily hydrolase (TIGR01509 family)
VIRAVIFDFDGLILETETLAHSVMHELFASYGVELKWETWAQIIGGSGGKFDMYAHLERLYGRPLDTETLRSGVRSRHRELVEGLELLPGVLEYIQDASAMSLKLGIASSSPREWVLAHLDQRGLTQYFEVIRTRTEIPRTKPSPALFNAVLESLGVAPNQTIALEDSPNGVTAAQAAGIFCLAVPNQMTIHLNLDHADLRVVSLAEFPLAQLINYVEGSR